MDTSNVTHVDVAIVGAGTAGLAALREIRDRTDDFVLINDGPDGSTCARVGCMPSKALTSAADAFHWQTTLDEFGVRGASHLRADIPAVLRRVRALRDGFVSGVLKATKARRLVRRCQATGRRGVGEGFGILSEIDVKATLKQELDRDFRRYVNLGACNPQLAYRALEAELAIGLLLPCNVCVWEEEGCSVVSIAKPESIFELVNRPEVEPVAKEADERLRRVLQHVSSTT